MQAIGVTPCNSHGKLFANYADNLLMNYQPLAVLSLLALSMFGSAHAVLPEPPKQMQARVISIQDGDTLTVMDSKRKTFVVQMDGVDAPELDQPYGQSSKLHLERRILRKNVVLLWHKTTGDGTLIAKVTMNNGDINLLQLRTGSAWTSGKVTVTHGDPDAGRYANAQVKAKEKLLGLWRDASAISPSEWRKQKAASAEAPK